MGLLRCSGVEVTRWQVAWGTRCLSNHIGLVAKITFLGCCGQIFGYWLR
jgi:hypothetical protein